MQTKDTSRKIEKIIIIVFVVGIVISLTAIILFPLYGISAGLNTMLNYNTANALVSSITAFYRTNERFPEAWEEVKDSYITNELYRRYGHAVHRLDEQVDINFQLLKEINHFKTLDNQPPTIEKEWILRLKPTMTNRVLGSNAVLGRPSRQLFSFLNKVLAREDVSEPKLPDSEEQSSADLQGLSRKL